MTITIPPASEPVTDDNGLVRPAWYRFMDGLRRVSNSAAAFVDIVSGTIGTLTPARGGTGVTALGNLTKTDDTNVTLTLSGTSTGALVNSIGMALGWSGVLAVARGGTGASAIPVISVKRATDQTGVATATFTKIQFNSEDIDNTATFDSATNYRWVPAVAGNYLIVAQATFAAVADTKVIAAAIYKNGSLVRFATQTMGGTGDGTAYAAGIIAMNGSTDYLEGYCYHEHGSNRDLRGGNGYSQMFGARISA